MGKRAKPKEIIAKLREAQVLIENWRLFYNTVRPHSALGYKPPAPRTILPATFTPLLTKRWFSQIGWAT